MAVIKVILKKMNIIRGLFARCVPQTRKLRPFVKQNLILWLITCGIVIVTIVFACFPRTLKAALPPDLFENKSEAGVFKSKVKRDIFYTTEEMADIKKLVSQQQADNAAPPQPMQPVTVQTSSQQALSQNQPQQQAAPVQDAGQSAPQTGSVEIFNVEGIIKMGNKGCAIINSRLWFVGKPEQGYELIKLHPEAVEIKLPDGKIVKHKLMKNR